MTKSIGNPLGKMHDGENKPVDYHFAYPLTGNLVDAIAELRKLHGDDIYLLPISGASCGSGVLRNLHLEHGTIVALKLNPPAIPRTRCARQVILTELAADEIVIDHQRHQVSAGAAITLEQLNRALADQLGPQFKVLGADLTSYQYAAVGATFMTGGMGPQRRYFSDSVVEAALYDGKRILSISGDALNGYAGTYGWTGIVSAVRCNYHRFPKHEIAIALPISNRPRELARLLARLAPYCFLSCDQAAVRSIAGRHGVITGIEQASSKSMYPLLRDMTANPSVSRAQDLRQKCLAAGVDGVVFISAYSDLSSDEFLSGLADDPQAVEPTIADINIEYADLFREPEQMRNLREAIPYAARMQTPAGRLLYKNHSDANIKIAPDKVAPVAARLWQINCDYVSSLEQHFREHRDVDGEILVYGHLNPYGIDPHNRVTLSSDDTDGFARSREFLNTQRARYYQQLNTLCHSGDAEFIGGEKTAASELGILQALGKAENWPAGLERRFSRQRRRIRSSLKIFNWRAPSIYRS